MKRTTWVAISWLFIALLSGCTMPTAGVSTATTLASPSPSEPAVEQQTETTPSPTPLPLATVLPTIDLQSPEAKATPSQFSQPISIMLFEDLDMIPGQMARLEEVGIEVTLVEAHGPRSDCFDCPNSAILRVRSDGETQELSYSFSGNMVFELLQRARRKSAFGYVFIARKISEGNFTLRIEPEKQ